MKLYNLRKLIFYLLLVIIISCQPAYLKLPPEINVQGVYKHKHLPIHFPESISGFKRVRIVEYSEEEKNVSVGYNHRTLSKNITFTIYLTADSLLDVYSGDTLRQVVIKTRSGIEYFYEKVKVISDEKSEFKDVYPGRKIIFKLKDPQKPYMSISELHVFKLDHWVMKYRISYPEKQQSLVKQDIIDIIGKIESYYTM